MLEVHYSKTLTAPGTMLQEQQVWHNLAGKSKASIAPLGLS